MSSILKALQQLEKQRSFEKISDRPDLNTVDATTVIRRQARQNRRSKHRRLIGLIVLIIGIGALFALSKNLFWNPRPDTSKTSPRKTVAAISKLPTDSEVKKPASVSSAHPQKHSAPTSRPGSPTKIVEKKVTTGKKHLTALKPTPSPRTTPKSVRTAPTVRKQPKKPKLSHQKAKAVPQKRKTRKTKITLKPPETVASVSRPSKAAIPDKHIKKTKRENLKAQSPQLTPSEAPKKLGLNLQAITWLNNPEKRFTVINNSIIRLGEMVDGFRLTRIEEDRVTVEKDNQKWLLKFSRINYSNGSP